MRERKPPVGAPAPAEREPAVVAPVALPEQLLALQRGAGNAAVARLVARQEDAAAFQLTPPSLLQPPRRPGISLGDWRLRLNSQVQMQMLDAELQPERIRAYFRQLPIPAPPPAPPPTPLAGPAPAPPRSPGDRPPGPFDVTPTEPGTAGDIATALASVPEIDRLSTAVRTQLWTRLPSEGKWTLAISGIVIGGAGLTGALASPSGRQALAGLGGRPLSIPGVPWFQPEFNVQGQNILVGLHVDVGAFLNGRGGFGTADRGPTPLTPPSPER